jgi:phenylacetate-CoA ligase
MRMTPGERARFVAFWALDRARGGRVRTHVRDLARLNDDPALLSERRAEQLRHLLSHACRTTAYYRQFSGADELSDFPVLQKKTIRERHADFLSSDYAPDSLIAKRTSGSYGTPLAFYFSPEKAVRHRAEVIYHTRWAGYEIGLKHAQTRTRSVKTPLYLWLQNQVIMNPTHLTEQWLAEQRHLLRTQKIKLMIGFPSAFRAIAVHCRAAGDAPEDFMLRAVIGIAEPLREEARREIETAFGCPAYSRYTTEEFGVLGQECPPAKQHHLNRASYVFELLRPDADEPAPPGQPGRVVVTDLWSHAMPLIRYDLGDMAVMAERCACGWDGPVFTQIEGRAVETVFDAVGDRVSPFAVNSAIQDLDGIIQFQFVQRAPARYTVRLVTLPSFAGEETIRNRLRPILGGEEAQLAFDYVPEIAPLPSGKRPIIVNQMQAGEAAADGEALAAPRASPP